MKYYNEKTKELKDNKIIKTLRQCAEDYEKGEILEVAFELKHIYDAIMDFANDCDE